MGAIERNGWMFATEFSVVQQQTAIQVYHQGEFVEEVTLPFEGNIPNHDYIEDFVAQYCEKHNI